MEKGRSLETVRSTPYRFRFSITALKEARWADRNSNRYGEVLHRETSHTSSQSRLKNNPGVVRCESRIPSHTPRKGPREVNGSVQVVRPGHGGTEICSQQL